MGFLSGKRALIVGVASGRSIASGIAEAMHREGAELAFSYQTDKLKGRVEEVAEATGSRIVLPCDVAHDEQIQALMDGVAAHWDGIDILVHSVGFAPREQLSGRFIDAVTREGFAIAHDISAYSLAALAKAAQPLMKGRKGSILTLSYLGAVRALPSYNVMGLAKASLEACVRFLALDLGPEGTRVNGISAGPIKTLAAAGIANFRKMLHHVEHMAPLKRSVSIEEVGNVAAFLCSDLASGVTGEITYVDAGYSTVGMSFDAEG
jgi:enoyl-[acyl-carrier protein] reductase I